MCPSAIIFCARSLEAVCHRSASATEMVRVAFFCVHGPPDRVAVALSRSSTESKRTAAAAATSRSRRSRSVSARQSPARPGFGNHRTNPRSCCNQSAAQHRTCFLHPIPITWHPNDVFCESWEQPFVRYTSNLVRGFRRISLLKHQVTTNAKDVIYSGHPSDFRESEQIRYEGRAWL